MASSVSRAANRGWREASRQSLIEQTHLFSSVVSLFALNPLVLPAVLLASLLALSKCLTKYPVVRTILYLVAVVWTHTVIYAIRAVAPACFAYLSYAVVYYSLPLSLSHSLPPLYENSIGWFALAYSAVEVWFFFYTLARSRRLQRRVPQPDFPNARRWLTFRRVEEASHCVQTMNMPRNCVHWNKFKHIRHHNDTAQTHHHHQHHSHHQPSIDQLASNPLMSALPDGQHPLEFLSGWYFNVPLRHIKHDNLMVFFAENTLGLALDELSVQQRDELEEIVKYIQLKATRLSRAHLLKKEKWKKWREQGRKKHTLLLNEQSNNSSTIQQRLSKNNNNNESDTSTTPIITVAALRAGKIPLKLLSAEEAEEQQPGAPLSASNLNQLNRATNNQAAFASPPSATSSSSASSTSTSPPSGSSISSTSSSSLSPSRPCSTSPDSDSSTPSEGDASSAISPFIPHSRREARGDRSVLLNLSQVSNEKYSAADVASVEQTIIAQMEVEGISIPYSPSPSPSPSPALSSANGDTPSHYDWSTHVSLGTLPPGRATEHDPMLLALSEVKYLHRPLAIYAGVYGLGVVASIYMRYLGFSHHSMCGGRLSYWYRRAELTSAELSADTPRADPLVLIHGIGIGCFTYLHMIRQLCHTKNTATCEQRSVYVIELPYISMKSSIGGDDDVPSPPEHVQAMQEMLFEHEMQERQVYQKKKSSSVASFFSSPSPSLDELQQSSHPIKALFVGHSYGTFVVTWVVKHRSDIVSSAVLIDPVSLMVFDPALIYNFLYRTPFSLVTHIYNFFTSRELGINHTLCRHFWWFENNLWREECERIGMSPSELGASLIAEREQCVASLPFEELLADLQSQNENESCIIEETEEEIRRAITDGKHKSDGSKQQQQHTIKRTSNSAFPALSNTHSSSASATASSSSLSSPTSSSTSSSLIPEFPLCPSSSLGVRLHLFLASNDDISPVGSIVSYLRSSIALQESKWGVGEAMIRFKVFEAVGHAEALFHREMREEIINTIQAKESHKQMEDERQKKKADSEGKYRFAKTPTQ